jgi:hypothetical protein
MSQRFNHKRVQDNLDGQETQKLELGDMAIASRLSESVGPQEFLPDIEKNLYLMKLKHSFQNLRKIIRFKSQKKLMIC